MIRKWAARAVFWLLLAFYIALMWVMMWAAEKMEDDYDYAARVRHSE
jgi:hypothetical protein